MSALNKALSSLEPGGRDEVARGVSPGGMAVPFHESFPEPGGRDEVAQGVSPGWMAVPLHESSLEPGGRDEVAQGVSPGGMAVPFHESQGSRPGLPYAALRALEMVLVVLLAAGCRPDSSRPASELSSAAPGLTAQEDHSDLLAELEDLRRNGSYQEGLSRVRQALGLSPNEALLHFHLGLLLQSTGDFEAAEAAVGRALELQPAHYPSHRVLGDLARQRGAPAEAEECYRRCVSGLPDHAGCRYGLGLSLVDLGELDAAAEHLGPAAEQLDRADVWSELGQLERRRRRVQESIVAFSHALALDRNHLPALLGMGQELLAAGRKDTGQALLERHRVEAARQDQIDALRRAANQPGAPVDVLLQLAQLHRSRDDFEAAEAALREALDRSPRFPPAVLALANHRLHRGDAEEADELVEGLTSQMAGDPAVLFLQGTIDVARGDAAAAAAHFDASLAKGPWPPPVYLDAGKAWSRAGYAERAAAAFERAASGLPDSAEAHLGRAESRRTLGAADQALASLERALELDPAGGRAWLLLGVLRAERGDREAAGRAFARGLEARKLDLLAANGAAEIRREVAAFAPSIAVLELFDQALASF